MEQLVENYIESLERTFNRQNNVNDLNHLIMGVSSEAGEVVDLFKKVIGYGAKEDESFVNKLTYELGDLIWYTTMLQLYTRSTVAIEVEQDSVPKHTFDKVVTSAKLFEFSAKLYQVNHGSNEFRQAIFYIVAIVNQVANNYGISMEDVLIKNLTKLQKRHGNSFNKEANHEEGRNRLSEESN